MLLVDRVNVNVVIVRADSEVVFAGRVSCDLAPLACPLQSSHLLVKVFPRAHADLAQIVTDNDVLVFHRGSHSAGLLVYRHFTHGRGSRFLATVLHSFI
jgi:hypothetical protein